MKEFLVTLERPLLLVYLLILSWGASNIIIDLLLSYGLAVPGIAEPAGAALGLIASAIFLTPPAKDELPYDDS